MAGSDLHRLISYIVQRLHDDATLLALLPGDVHDSPPPMSTPYPFAVVEDAGNVSVDGVGDIRVGVLALVTVRVIDNGEDYELLQAPVERVEALLHAFTTSNSELAYVTSKRLEEVRRAYTEDGYHYREMGARYQVFARSS